VSDGICGLGRFEQGLAGHATDPGAIAAQLTLLDQRNREMIFLANRAAVNPAEPPPIISKS